MVSLVAPDTASLLLIPNGLLLYGTVPLGPKWDPDTVSLLLDPGGILLWCRSF